MISSRAKTRLAIALMAIGLVFWLVAVIELVILRLDASYEPPDSLTASISDLFISFSFLAMGGLIAGKRPDNLVGWALLIGGLGVSDFLGNYAYLALLAKPESDLPGGVAAWTIYSGSWTPLIGGIFFLLLLFPNGSLPSPRWRLPAIIVPIFLAIGWVGIATYPTPDPPFEDLENPLAFTSNDDYFIVILPLIISALLTVVAAGVNLILRFRRALGDEREQYKWLAYAVGLLILSWPFAAVVNYSGIAATAFAIAVMAIPIAVGIAVLRYRLYDIDILINRTLVYVPLTAILAGLFVASTTLVRTVFTDLTDAGSDASIAVSTLLVVAVLTPLKNKLQALVDRHFKEQPDPLRELRRTATEARSVLQVMDLDRLLARLLDGARTGLDAGGAAIVSQDKATLLTSGSWEGDARLSLPLHCDGREVGMLLLGPRRSGRAYAPNDGEALRETTEALALALSLPWSRSLDLVVSHED